MCSTEHTKVLHKECVALSTQRVRCTGSSDLSLDPKVITLFCHTVDPVSTYFTINANSNALDFVM